MEGAKLRYGLWVLKKWTGKTSFQPRTYRVDFSFV